MFETIVALATAPLKSALHIVRLSGDDCFDIVGECFSKKIENITKRTIKIGSIINNDTKIDDVVLCLYKGPKSFTGEDSVEIICHGSTLIANEIIGQLLSKGARLATNGEFSSRAYMHNKIDLVQAEAINDLINSTSSEAKNLSILSLDGKTSELLRPIKKSIGDLISLIEVNIDYPEYEDIEIANKEKIIISCREIKEKIDILSKQGEEGKIVKEGLNVAIVGEPNVGKSSLLNTLLGEDKAIVTDIAGTTRDIVEGDVNIGGITLHLLDTAGIRNSSNTVEAIGIEKSLSSIEKADLVLVVIDATKPDTEETKAILTKVGNKEHLKVFNKCDLIHREFDGVRISAKMKDIEELKQAIFRKIGISKEAFKLPSLNNTRQIGLLKKASNCLDLCINDAENNYSVDLISVNLLSAYKAILEILGEENQLDLAKEIFSRFCVGK